MPRRGDRHVDQRLTVDGVAKPPVLGRATLRAACLTCLAIIVYGTLGPVSNAACAWVVPVEQWRWLPPARAADINDLITNFIVYVPVGVALRLLVRRRGRAGTVDLLLGLALSVALSYVTEVLQQAMPARVSSRTDIVINGIAALLGCLCAVPLQKLIREIHALCFAQLREPWRVWLVLTWAAVIATAALMTVPWQLRRPDAEWGFDRVIGPADVRRGAMFALTGFLCTGMFRLRGWPPRPALGAAWGLLLLPAFGLELLQIVLTEHVCSFLHALISLAGAGIGGGLALLLVNVRPDVRTDKPEYERGPHPRPHRWLAAVLLIALTCAAAHGAWRGLAQVRLRASPAVNWLPFRPQFEAPFLRSATAMIEEVALYAVLTMICLFLARARGRATALLLLVGLVGALETGRAFLAGHVADTTSMVLAAAGWLLATRVWSALFPTSAGSHGGPVATYRATSAAARLPVS